MQSFDCVCVCAWLQGDGVFACSDSFFPHIRNGCYAEHASVAERHLALLPPHLSFEEAAVMPLVALTAWQARIGWWDPAGQLLTGLGGCRPAGCLPACRAACSPAPELPLPSSSPAHSLADSWVTSTQRYHFGLLCRPSSPWSCRAAAASWCMVAAGGWAAWLCSWPSTARAGTSPPLAAPRTPATASEGARATS